MKDDLFHLSLAPVEMAELKPALRTCPRCSYARKPDDTAPPWQCPRCEIAYDKAEQPPPAVKRRVAEREVVEVKKKEKKRQSGTLAWVCLAVAVAAGGGWGVQRWRVAHPSAAELAVRAEAQARLANVQAAAKEQEVVAELKLAQEHLNMARTEQAMAILERYTAQKNPQAMVQLAIVLRDGYRVKEDLPRAMDLMARAAAEGFAAAYVNLGFASETGKGAPQSWDEAINQYGKAARAGNMSGLYALGRIHANGVPGVPPNPYLAHVLLDLADRAFRKDPAGDSLSPQNRTAFWATGDVRKLAEAMSPADVARAKAFADSWQPGQPFPTGS